MIRSKVRLSIYHLFIASLVCCVKYNDLIKESAAFQLVSVDSEPGPSGNEITVYTINLIRPTIFKGFRVTKGKILGDKTNVEVRITDDPTRKSETPDRDVAITSEIFTKNGKDFIKAEGLAQYVKILLEGPKEKKKLEFDVLTKPVPIRPEDKVFAKVFTVGDVEYYQKPSSYFRKLLLITEKDPPALVQLLDGKKYLDAVPVADKNNVGYYYYTLPRGFSAHTLKVSKDPAIKAMRTYREGRYFDHSLSANGKTKFRKKTRILRISIANSTLNYKGGFRATVSYRKDSKDKKLQILSNTKLLDLQINADGVSLEVNGLPTNFHVFTSPCTIQKCLNGGSCVVDGEFEKGFGCVCKGYFTGEFCQRNEELTCRPKSNENILFDRDGYSEGSPVGFSCPKSKNGDKTLICQNSVLYSVEFQRVFDQGELCL